MEIETDENRRCSHLAALVACLLFGAMVEFLGWKAALGVMLVTVMGIGVRNIVREWPLKS